MECLGLWYEVVVELLRLHLENDLKTNSNRPDLSGSPFEHIAFLLIYGHLPAAEEAAYFQKSIAETPLPPQSVFDLIKSFP